MRNMNVEIKNGRVIDPAAGIDATQSVYIVDGRIAALNNMPKGFKADRVIDASGKIVCPGLVDLSARLREPGNEHKATLESEMRAAVAGGVTSLVCPPDTDPPLDEPGLVEMLKRRADALKQARVYPLGALTQGLRGERLAEMGELTEAGCVGFFQADHPLTDTNVLWRAMQYAATHGYTLWLRPEDAHLAADGVAHDGEMATRLGLPAIPAIAETIAVQTIVTLVSETGCRVHLARLSAAPSVAVVAAAKKAGLPLTCDVGIHHLLLADRDIGYFDPQYRFRPPLRDVRDRDALRQGVVSGVIDAICSDHTPVDDDEKQVPFGEATPGATGLELLLPLTLKFATEMKLPLKEALAKITSAPAKMLGISAGTLTVGTPADLCIFDEQAFWAVTPRTLCSQGKNTPWMKRELVGKVTQTLVGGQTVFPG
jgi:dihydroorotase